MLAILMPCGLLRWISLRRGALLLVAFTSDYDALAFALEQVNLHKNDESGCPITYVWEATASGSIAGSRALNQETGKAAIAVQIRNLKVYNFTRKRGTHELFYAQDSHARAPVLVTRYRVARR